MLVKISSLSECKEKGFTLNKQIETEAKELADAYAWSARLEIDEAKGSAHTPELRKLLNDPKTVEKAVKLAQERAWKETAEKYRVMEVPPDGH